MNYEVYAENEKELQMFLMQHNFTDSPMDSVTVLPRTEIDRINDGLILKEFLFKSNKTNQIYKVIT